MSSLATPVEAGSAKAGELAGRVVLVVGAHGGLGSAAAVACAREGANVVLLGRRVPKLNRMLDAIAASGGEASAYPLDLEGASPDDYARLAETIEAEFGHLDGVLHCAAEFRGLTPLMHTDPAAFARAIHVNLTAPWWLTQACLPLLVRAPDAAVVFAAEDLSRVGQAFWGGYGAAKHGLAGLVSTLHAELANSSVRVSALDPGPMRTALRGKAYVEDQDRGTHEPATAAERCVTLLSRQGAAYRGRVWSPDA